MEPEPDWSAAAFWLAVRALGCAVAVTGLRRDSLQGDRAAAALCRCLPEEVDLTDIPDLLPPLALLAALRPGTEPASPARPGCGIRRATAWRRFRRR